MAIVGGGDAVMGTPDEGGNQKRGAETSAGDSTGKKSKKKGPATARSGN
jgi:hypothetical protein